MIEWTFRIPPEATSHHFLSPEQKHKGIISCRRYEIQRNKKEKKICPVSLKFTRLLARSLNVEKIKEKKMNEWMDE